MKYGPVLETLSDSRQHCGVSSSRIVLKALRGISLQSLYHLQLLPLLLLTTCLPDFSTRHHYHGTTVLLA